MVLTQSVGYVKVVESHKPTQEALTTCTTPCYPTYMIVDTTFARQPAVLDHNGRYLAVDRDDVHRRCSYCLDGVCGYPVPAWVGSNPRLVVIGERAKYGAKVGAVGIPRDVRQPDTVTAKRMWKILDRMEQQGVKLEDQHLVALNACRCPLAKWNRPEEVTFNCGSRYATVVQTELMLLGAKVWLVFGCRASMWFPPMTKPESEVMLPSYWDRRVFRVTTEHAGSIAVVRAPHPAVASRFLPMESWVEAIAGQLVQLLG